MAGEADRGPAERVELRRDRGHESTPAGRLVDRAAVRRQVDGLAAVRREPDPVVGRALDAHAEVERDRQHEPAAVVGVLPDQVRTARCPKRAGSPSQPTSVSSVAVRSAAPERT